MSIRVLLRDHPHRALALVTSAHALIFRYVSSGIDNHPFPSSLNPSRNASTTSFQSLPASVHATGSSTPSAAPRCMVEFLERDAADLRDFRPLTGFGSSGVHGTLGLMTVGSDVFLCVVNSASKVAQVRERETVLRIGGVEFYCLNNSDYDHVLHDEINPYSTDDVGEDGFEHRSGRGPGEPPLEHPCLALKKLLSSGTFYYSADFDLTKRLQDRPADAATVDIESLDDGFLWNSHMIKPLVDFRSRLPSREKNALDDSKLLTSAIRGFVMTITVPPSSSPARSARSGLPSTLTLISRLSCRRAGTRFNARGIDDDGNVANFVQTETVFATPDGICFSYVQMRGSVPLFWEQSSGLLPNQQKIQITRSTEATQPAFDRHFEELESDYGAVHIVNLLSNDKPGELELTQRYRFHVQHSSVNQRSGQKVSEEHQLLKETDYDFHAETRGPYGYEAASGIRYFIQDSADAFAYYLSEEVEEAPRTNEKSEHMAVRRPIVILQQEGVFRVNCLDCLDRTNLVQTILSQMALETFLAHRGERASNDFWNRHGTLWADNGDALSRIYAGTGALKSSFTRSGKMSLAGALADVRKSATRVYINNFADKGRQNTIDMLLGRLMGQAPVSLFDPLTDYVHAELTKRAAEYSSTKSIYMWVGTFNLNGRGRGVSEDLSPWLCPPVDATQEQPEIVAVGFQEIVELSPQQIMSTDPSRRQAWESAVKRTLNDDARKRGTEEYVILRGGQLVGASLSIFVKASQLKYIKNVEGSLKKTGMSGIAGNKGAVAIRMDYANTTICFVTAHLAAGFANYEERNRDFKTINDGLRFQHNRTINDHDAIVWLGDFNYRIGLGDEKVRKLIQVGDLDTLYQNDQLNLQMVAGLTFPYYSEARITFKPTYKYDLGVDQYDTSEKQRIPAWTDRILRKGNNLRQINYDAAPLRFSDHRPVYATFNCTVNIINEAKKEMISKELYTARRSSVGDALVNGDFEDSDDEDLIEYESVQPGLPSASSDRRKWWIEHGMPARSTVKPPSQDHIPNPNRPSNPFAPSSEPDWVKVEKPPGGLSRTSSWQVDGSSDAKPPPPPRNLPSRKLPPPINPPPNNGTIPHLLDRSPSISSTASDRASILSKQTSRKPAPPIPKKPKNLSSPTAEPSSPATSTVSDAPLPPPRSSIPSAKSTPTPPAPRRGTAVAAALSRQAPGELKTASPVLRRHGEQAEGAPVLPPRRRTDEDLLGAGADEQLHGWKPLQPR
ncbi:hypothetical protein EV356DRAFT_502391 [Viridothelium virens]|uniref:phosphoinositide 5-phosphatase n=1 Tax=Viridothelium virens TaxID=1048519 RepID=A0A6A6HN96_VIRVR|nr:hypothetical protein EV356DRAFT_502391 [Viridothelium virens]